MLSVLSLLALSLPLALGWRNPFYEYKSYQVARQSDPTAYVFLCNCWANPGARSEVDFFSDYPTNFGNATPEYASVISPNNNYVWQNGGSAKDPNGGTFKWTITNKQASTNAKAGNATDGTNTYIILRDTESTLYQPTSSGKKYNCIVVYRCQLDNSATTPPSTNTTTSVGPTTTPTSGPITTPTPTPSDTPDSGLSSSTKMGIGLGVGLGLGLPLIALAAFFIWRRRQERSINQEPMMGVYPSEKKAPFPQDAGAGGASLPNKHLVSELQNDHIVSEMSGGAEATEVDAEGQTVGRYQRVPNSPIEMDAGGRYTPH